MGGLLGNIGSNMMSGLSTMGGGGGSGSALLGLANLAANPMGALTNLLPQGVQPIVKAINDPMGSLLSAIQPEQNVQQPLGGGKQPTIGMDTNMLGNVTPYNEDIVTKLTPKQEIEFQTWFKKRAEKLKLNPDPDDPNQFYDARGAWLAGYRTTSGHLPDIFKLPGHPTFSNESIYYNPGMNAGYWSGQNYNQFNPLGTPGTGIPQY